MQKNKMCYQHDNPLSQRLGGGSSCWALGRRAGIVDLHATVGRGAGVGDLYVDLHV